MHPKGGSSNQIDFIPETVAESGYSYGILIIIRKVNEIIKVVNYLRTKQRIRSNHDWGNHG